MFTAEEKKALIEKWNFQPPEPLPQQMLEQLAANPHTMPVAIHAAKKWAQQEEEILQAKLMEELQSSK